MFRQCPNSNRPYPSLQKQQAFSSVLSSQSRALGLSPPRAALQNTSSACRTTKPLTRLPGLRTNLPKMFGFRLVGARALGWASSVLALAYDGQFRSMGIVLLCGVLIGLADTVVIWRNGVRRMAVSHIVGTSLLAATDRWIPCVDAGSCLRLRKR